MAEPVKRPVTLEELLVKSRIDGRLDEAFDREGADHTRKVHAEDYRGTGDISKSTKSHIAMNNPVMARKPSRQ